MKAIIAWALAVLVTANTIWFTVRANYNTGMLLMWILSVLLLVYAIFHKYIDEFCRQGIGFALKCLFFTGIGIFALLFLFVAVSGYTNSAKNDEKAIIVLGAGLRGERVGDVLRRRLDAALDAWQQNPEAVLVVTGGQAPGEDIPEAVAMQRWLGERGVPEDKILLEDKSTSTEENLSFAKQILLDAGISPDSPVAVVTNAFHCYRAGRYAGMAGFAEVRTIPASMNLTAVLPSYMREVLAILYMWVFRRSMA